MRAVDFQQPSKEMGVGYRCDTTSMMVGDEREIKGCLANWSSARVGFSLELLTFRLAEVIAQYTMNELRF
jgi:hypothetical protein